MAHKARLTMLTASEFAERYKVGEANALNRWRRILLQVREEGKLKPGQYTFRYEGRDGRPSYAYSLPHVLSVVAQMDAPFPSAVRMAYHDEIRAVLLDARAQGVTADTIIEPE